MYIRKGRDIADDWMVYHKDFLTSGGKGHEYMKLNDTIISADFTAAWNDTAPTSSVFSVGTDASVNTDTKLFVTYLFSGVEGYSKFGYFIGNGNANGTFVYTGFSPSFIMMKSDTSAYSWITIDNARDPDNIANHRLWPNETAAEGASEGIDFLANGFKLRGSGVGQNAGSGHMIYAAFAETPFKYATAR